MDTIINDLISMVYSYKGEVMTEYDIEELRRAFTEYFDESPDTQSQA